MPGAGDCGATSAGRPGRRLSRSPSSSTQQLVQLKLLAVRELLNLTPDRPELGLAGLDTMSHIMPLRPRVLPPAAPRRGPSPRSGVSSYSRVSARLAGPQPEPRPSYMPSLRAHRLRGLGSAEHQQSERRILLTPSARTGHQAQPLRADRFRRAGTQQRVPHTAPSFEAWPREAGRLEERPLPLRWPI